MYKNIKPKRKLRQARTVRCYSTDGVLLGEYPSSAEASRQTGFSQPSILKHCKREVKRVYGLQYIWRFADDDDIQGRRVDWAKYREGVLRDA